MQNKNISCDITTITKYKMTKFVCGRDYIVMENVKFDAKAIISRGNNQQLTSERTITKRNEKIRLK